MAAPPADDCKTPSDIQFDTLVIDVCCHPTRDAVAVGTVDGDVKIYLYQTEGTNHELLSLMEHKKSCRGVRFSQDGTLLFTCSKDKSLLVADLNTGAIIHRLCKAHESAIYSLLVISNYLVATGDDDGVFKVWDFRRQTAVMEAKNCEEYISCLMLDKEKRTVLAASGEGSLTAFNLSQRKMELQSELFDSEFLSLAFVKGGNKLVVGTGEGALNIFNAGEWGNISDRFPGYSTSIDSIVPVGDDIICTGCGDGIIRAVYILPNRFVGVVGKHEFPVENMSLSRDGKLLASCSHDQTVKFWNLSCLEGLTEDPNAKPDRNKKAKNLASRNKDFFAGLT